MIWISVMYCFSSACIFVFYRFFCKLLHCSNTQPFKCLGLLRIFNVFEGSLLCTPRLHLFDKKCSCIINVFGLDGIDLLRCCWIAAAVGYCCCRLLLLQRKYRNLILPIHAQIWCCEYTAAAQVAYITYSRSVQVELGKVEGFRGTLCYKML